MSVWMRGDPHGTAKVYEISHQLYGHFHKRCGEGGRTCPESLPGGGAIESVVAVSRGEYLKLQINLPDQATLLGIDLAPVRWVDGKAFGVEFISMQPSAKDTLNRCVAELDELLRKARLSEPIIHMLLFKPPQPRFPKVD